MASPSSDPSAADNLDAAAITVEGNANRSVTKVFSGILEPPTLEPGQLFASHIDVTNDEPSVAAASRCSIETKVWS